MRMLPTALQLHLIEFCIGVTLIPVEHTITHTYSPYVCETTLPIIGARAINAAGYSKNAQFARV